MLNYNSQMWRNISGGAWLAGEDTGYGMGWKLQAGSLTPVWAGPTVIDHYIFTDATGARYNFSINTNNVWTPDCAYFTADEGEAPITISSPPTQKIEIAPQIRLRNMLQKQPSIPALIVRLRRPKQLQPRRNLILLHT
jgi:hypothetical protein